MTWNKVNSDLLAVGYGQFGFNEQSKPKGGLACCWNLKNPEVSTELVIKPLNICKR